MKRAQKSQALFSVPANARELEIAVQVIMWWHHDDDNFGKEEPDFLPLCRQVPGARKEAIRRSQQTMPELVDFEGD